MSAAPRDFTPNLFGEIPIDEHKYPYRCQPRFYITVTQGGAGWFAVMIWDGLGHEEPYDTGIGRYPTREAANGRLSSIWSM